MRNEFDIFTDGKLISEIPKEPGVYIIRSNENEILYIGKAKDLQKRIKAYLSPDKLDIFKSSMVREAKSVEIMVVSSELEALLLESNLIKEHRPPYNVVLRDDKSYPYLRISLSEKYPRLSIARRIKNKRDFYFGPVTPADKLKRLIKILKSSYKIAQKNDKSCQGSNSACIYYQMNLCKAPCVGYISKEEYDKMINEIKSILSNPRPLKKRLKEELEACIKNENFEKAIEIRDKLKAIEILEDKQTVSEINENFLDVFVFEQREVVVCAYIINIRFSNMVGSRSYFFYDSRFDNDAKESFLVQYYSSGEIIPDTILTDSIKNTQTVSKAIEKFGKKPIITIPKRGRKKALLNLAKKNAEILLETHTKSIKDNIELFDRIKETFSLKKMPYIIDIADISHTGFENVVGGIVRYSINGFEKDMYRRYSLKKKFESEAMEELLKRHKQLLLRGYKKLPDIVLVDGGVVQTESASRVFDKNIVIGIAKEKENGKTKRDLGDVEDRIFFKGQIKNVDKDILMLFQKLRDEAHRFAISYHRTKREKSTASSILDRVGFIGIKRKRALFEKFGSIENIKKASVEELTQVKGITPKIAVAIKEKLNNETINL